MTSRRGSPRLGNGGPVGAGKTTLAAAFCRVLGERLSVAAGKETGRKGAVAIAGSDILVTNKTDRVPYVGASLGVMQRDAERMCQGRAFVFAGLKSGEGIEAICQHLSDIGGLRYRT